MRLSLPENCPDQKKTLRETLLNENQNHYYYKPLTGHYVSTGFKGTNAG